MDLRIFRNKAYCWIAKFQLLPNLEYLKACLDYNIETGQFIWRKRPLEHFMSARSQNSWNTQNAGKVAGCTPKGKTGGYVFICVNGANYPAHRLVWLFVYGKEPRQLDHINHNRADNQIDNLREASQKENCRNGSARRNNTGFPGVNRRSNGRFRAQLAGKHLGYFSTAKEAHEAWKEAKQPHGFHFNHGA